MAPPARTPPHQVKRSKDKTRRQVRRKIDRDPASTPSQTPPPRNLVPAAGGYYCMPKKRQYGNRIVSFQHQFRRDSTCIVTSRASSIARYNCPRTASRFAMLRANGSTGTISPNPVEVSVVKLKYSIELTAVASPGCAGRLANA